MAAAPGSTKISWRVAEFEAHSGAVTCAALSKSTGRLLATGGDDCRVNIWAVSKTNCIMSLTGHKTAVECVQVNWSEEQIAAGSQSGSIRVWDLKAAKSLRTLMGHKSNVTSLSFHPFGNFLASSSLDTNIKLWDVRRKGYVFRLKGHSQAVRNLAFSPDGKWLASAGDDCTVKLWDLSQGKTITEFTSHSAAISMIQFHPNEYLLASGSHDRTIKLWDLEKFSMVSSLEGDTTPVRCARFSLDGSCLFSAASDSLRVFGWEPDRCFDVVPVGWGRVSDLSICHQQLIGVSHQLSTVSTYVVDLKRVKQSGGSVLQGILQDDSPLAEPMAPRGAAATLRRNYERPTTSCSSLRVRQRPDTEMRSSESEKWSLIEDEGPDDKPSSAEIHNPEDYKEIFQPKTAISRTPPQALEPFPAPPLDESFESTTKQQKKVSPFPDKQQHLEQEDFIQAFVFQLKSPPLTASMPAMQVEPTIVSFVKSPLATPPRSPPSSAKHFDIILSNMSVPIGLNVADFLQTAAVSPRAAASPRVAASPRAVALSDEEALTQMRKGHDTMWVILSSRLKNLQTVRAVWACKGAKSALDAAVSMNDLSIIVDLLNIISLQPSMWKLDLCETVLPQIDKLLQSKYESYMQTGCSSLRLIMKHFWPLISETLQAMPPVGIDITREERHHRCQLCWKLLRKLSVMVRNNAGQVGRHGSTYRELQLLMAPLDDAQ